MANKSYMAMNFFLLSILVYISPTLSEIRKEVFLPLPKIRNIFSKLEKRQGDGGYLEQCEIVDFGAKKLGTVNVLAFLDASWQYSHRQAAMLKELTGRFERSGMVDIKFFVINSVSPTIVEEAEIEIEEETWKAISPSEAEGFPIFETSLESLKKTLGPDIYFIEDNSELQIWKKLHVSRDQILVVDGCGKLTYQVIVPWSILHSPYVKAAILSTYKDEPCGPCKESNFEESSTMFAGEEDTTNFIQSSRTFSDDREPIFNKPIHDKVLIKTIEHDSTAAEEMETEETTTEEIKATKDITEKQINTGETAKQMKTEVRTTEEMETTKETVVNQMEAGETITEQIKIEETTAERMDETTTEYLKTITNETSEEEEEKVTTEYLKTVKNKTSEQEEEKVTTEQIKIVDTTIEETKTIETTTGQMKTNETNVDHPKTFETTTESAKTDEISMKQTETTIRQIIADATRIEQTKTTEATTKSDETTGEQTQVTGTTTEQMNKDETTLQQAKITETTTEQMNNDETTFQQAKITETTTDHMKTMQTTEKTTEFFTTSALESDVFQKEIHFLAYFNNNNPDYSKTHHKSQKPETETLRSTLNLENNNTDDLEDILLKDLSKFPNVRSISKSKNQIILDQKVEENSSKSKEIPDILPIRIIMKAPHLDVYNNFLIKHDYLILKTDDPNLHDHLGSGIKIDLVEGNYDFDKDLEKMADIWKIENRDFLSQNQGEVKSNNKNKTRNGWYGFHIKIDEDNNQDSRLIKKRIFGKDESPGLYSEVADYWRNDRIENFDDETFDDNQDDKNYDMEKDPNDDSETPVILKTTNENNNGTEEKKESSDQNEKIVANSINNEREEEAKSKLIAHYSKLLPWIYYVLN